MLNMKKEKYKKIISEIAKESFNNEQKETAYQIIDSANEYNIDSIYQLISQRVKTGFVFDAAPEVNHECIAIVNEDEDLFIDSNQAKTVEHKLIIGENYDALKNIEAAYIDHLTGEGLIDIIYIDPPYNTEKAKNEGNDYKDKVDSTKFIYRDKYTRDGWLNMMNERLKIAKKTLKNDGVIFISINDNEQAYLKVLCDEIFGENNFLISFHWMNTATPPSLSNVVRKKMEYVLMYTKKGITKKLSMGMISGGDAPLLNDGNALTKLVIPKEKLIVRLPNGIYSGKMGRVTILNDFIVENCEAKSDLVAEGNWKWTQKYLEEEIKNDTTIWIKSLEFSPRYKRVGERTLLPSNIISSTENNVGTNENAKKELEMIFSERESFFDYPKPVSLIKYLLKLYDKPNGIVLDFFAGSGTTGQAVMELNDEDGGSRQFILTTNNENNIAVDITWERLYRVINGIGSNNEKINWRYSEEIPCLLSNSVRVFKIDYHELKLHDFEKANALIPIAQTQFNNLNSKYNLRNQFDIYNELSALNPYKKV